MTRLQQDKQANKMISLINRTVKDLKDIKRSNISKQNIRYIMEGVLFEDVSEYVYKKVVRYINNKYNLD